MLPVARAATLGLDVTCSVSTCTGGQAGSLGWEFTVTSPTWVNGLAFYDYNSADKRSHAVGIYNSEGTLLVSTTVTPADPHVGSWLVQAVTPIQLADGTYDIMAVTGSAVAGEDYAAWDPLLTPSIFTTTGSITSVDAASYSPSTSSLTFPSTFYTTIQGFFGPSFTIGSTDDNLITPEPASFLLLGSGLLLAAGLRRYRHAR